MLITNSYYWTTFANNFVLCICDTWQKFAVNRACVQR